MKLTKKLLSLALVGAMALTTAACGGNKNNSGGGNGGGNTTGKETVLEVAVHNGGVGKDWLKAAGDRFSELMKEHSYADGKKGVRINITPANGLGKASMASEAYNVYFIERLDTFNLIQNNLLLDLSEVYATEENGKTIENRIYSEMLPSLKGNDGKYYVLPGWEFYSGMSYDEETFDFCGAYFAGEGETGINFNSNLFGNATFVGKNGTAKKSVGPDGKTGVIDGVDYSADDGLPSSLKELLILCEYLKNNGVEPISMTSQYPGYSKYLIAGLWASLAGYEQMKTCYTFDGTEVEIVKSDANGNLMFTDENLFPGIDYLKKPVTEKVAITEENGYLTNDMAAKYYAAAFLQIIEKEGFLPFSDGSSVSHTATQLNMLLGGSGVKGKTRKGMIIDGSYWWVESEMFGNFDNYTKMTKKDANDRKIKWMPLPVSFDTTVTSGNGEKNTLIDTGMGVCFINNNIKNNAELRQASIDFVKFCYSQSELAAFTESTGSMRPIEYTVNTDNVKSLYYKDLLKLRQNSDVMLFTGDNDTFKYNRGVLKIELSSLVTLAPTIGNKRYDNYLEAYDAGANAVSVFEATRFTKSYWATLTKS